MKNTNFKVGDKVRITPEKQDRSSLGSYTYIIANLRDNGADLVSADVLYMCGFAVFDILERVVVEPRQFFPEHIVEKLIELTKEGKIEWGLREEDKYTTKYACEVGGFYFTINKSISPNSIQFSCNYMYQKIDVSSSKDIELFAVVHKQQLTKHKTISVIMITLNSL